MTQARYLPEFWTDVAGAVDWLDSEQSGLGAELATSVLAAIRTVMDHPMGFAALEGGIRRLVIRRFRFLVFYEVVSGDCRSWA